MTVCDVCGGEQFTLEDGFYFCNECQTQSQDIREMVTENMYATGATLVRSTAISEKTLADRQRRRLMRAEARGVRPVLSSAEVLNLLLRRWTTVLVERGAPPQLPNVTAKMWEALLRSPQLSERNKRLHTFGTNLRTAVALLWLGLVECEPHCRLSDLMRWARQGVVPIYSAANELPEDVAAKWVTLCVASSMYTHPMRRLLFSMVNALSWPPPPQPTLRQLLRRLIAELALPARLADVVANVARRAPPLCTYLPEADALALLLVTLKMLLGLDDATEIRNSEVAAARNEAHPDGPRWFVFTEWLQLLRQLRTDAGEQDFRELDIRERDLPTWGGPDLCRRRHRQLLFDFYRREGVFRCGVEVPRGSSARYLRPEYKLQTGQLFGRPEALPAPASDADDLLRPVSARLEREGGEPLRRADMWRHSQVEFLIDESHVRRLQSEGVAVKVERGSARRRKVARHRCVSGVPQDIPANIELVDKRDEVPLPPELKPPRRERRRPGRRGARPCRDLRLFMPYRQVWCIPAAWRRRNSTARYDYQLAAKSWPASFHYLLETLAASIELTPRQFTYYVCHAESYVLSKRLVGDDDTRSEPNRSNVRRPTKKKTKSSEEGEEKSESSARPSISPTERKRMASGESVTEMVMVLGEDADTTWYSPDLLFE